MYPTILCFSSGATLERNKQDAKCLKWLLIPYKVYYGSKSVMVPSCFFFVSPSRFLPLRKRRKGCKEREARTGELKIMHISRHSGSHCDKDTSVRCFPAVLNSHTKLIPIKRLLHVVLKAQSPIVMSFLLTMYFSKFVFVVLIIVSCIISYDTKILRNRKLINWRHEFILSSFAPISAIKSFFHGGITLWVGNFPGNSARARAGRK